MKRRTFIQQSGLGLSPAVLPLSCFSNTKQPYYKMGLQVYSIRDAIAEDPLGTLKKVAAMGYEDLEKYPRASCQLYSELHAKYFR